VLRPIRKAAIAFVFVTVVGAAALLARPAAAAPTPEDKTKAREHYQKGLTHYDIKEFPEALAEFKNAYRIVQDPAFLFNIAQCYRKLGQDAEALDYYRNYVRRFPNAPNRAEVDRRIQEIEREQEARSLVGAPPPPTDTKPGPPNNNASKAGPVTPIAPPPPNGNTTAGGPPPPPLPPGGTTNTGATTPAIVATSPGPAAAESPSFYTRWWFWTAVGAVVVGAVVVGAIATRGEVGDCHGISPCRTVGP
jgi:hypothetical protein